MSAQSKPSKKSLVLAEDAAYLKNHICQCIFLDRKFCPVCEKKCHHDTPFSPKQVIDDSYGGLGAAKVVDVDSKREEEIVA